MKNYHIIFQPSGRRGEVPEGLSILEASRRLGVDIESICGEKRVCGKCRVRIEEGFFEKYGIESKLEHLSPFSPEEEKFISERERKEGYRLACASTIGGDLLVFVPEESRAGKQVVRKEATERQIELDPAVRLYYVEMDPPTFHEPTADFERLKRSLEQQHGLSNLSIDYRVIQKLPDLLRKGDWKVTASVWMGREIIRVQPGRVENLFGLAVDVGTTTVAGYFCNMIDGRVLATDSLMNPQVTYGEDVMSRITYSMMHPGEGLEKMSSVLIEGLNRIAANVASQAGLSPDEIMDMTIVGNTAMHHILLKINPEHVGLAPFSPAIHHSLDIKARELGIHIHESAYVHILPIEAGFVGADNVGVLIAEEPYHKEEMTLIIDIGTNGELVLGNKDKLISSSCATGPALEGAQITFGMRAAPGAIERIRIDRSTHEVDYRVIGREAWKRESDPEHIGAKGICGSGILDVLSEFYRTGIILKSGAFNKSLNSPRLRKNEKGVPEFVIAWAPETSIDRDITVSLKDIRQIQLAKGALYTGAKLMMRRLGIEKVDKVILAGAFGTYVDPQGALIMGMFPDCDPADVHSVGNAAGDGARIALLNVKKRDEANEVARRVEYIELTVEPDFQKEFMEAMQIPHMKDRFPHLEKILPPEILNQ